MKPAFVFRFRWLFFAFWLFSSPVLGQKVALVLSGGGAKGAAHLGVIKALEENNIPIDYIIGTSMGGVVGGFYAAGYSVEEMEELIKSEDVLNWVTGVQDEKYRYFLYRREENASMLSLKLSLDSLLKASIKSTLVNDNGLNFALASYLGQASAR
ncbi:MAG TPA: patatin, partial [Microscillaceae bacterium]|nr:patatin [Microscillaceae bacterium]